MDYFKRGGSKPETARQLGISVSSIYRIINDRT
ncbi:helix-turn-helix domain-containing protein [Providencia sp. PROV194]